eukprot:TRINITY_DN10454_c0_g1_i1.p1 TRINITY_DN10454_c0_g1~~TRINITY_DN10454_c0_g1_i1.p1  ORF type:complete len:389 (-),score=115.34 TRINITY_DN10454_c0_g1_i1:149-1315(-)
MDAEKGLHEAIIQHLRVKAVDSGIISQLSGALGVDASSTSATNLLDLYKNHATVAQVTQTSSTEQPQYDQAAEAKFVEYIELLKKRGYFRNVEEGSADYNDRLQKARERFFVKYTPVNAPAAETSASSTPDIHAALSKEERVRLGDEHKVKANELLTKRQWEEAIKEYTIAIEYNQNAIYYTNRALANQRLGNLTQALDDAKKAIQVDSKYSKAYARLGDIHVAKKDYAAAIKAYESGLAVDPTAQNLKSGLENAKSLQSLPASLAGAGGMGGMGGMDDIMSRMPGMGGMPGGFDPNAMADAMRNMGVDPSGGEGINPYLAQMMNNPQVMQAAQQMMMENPQLMEMAQAISQDPSMMQSILQGQMPAGLQIPENLQQMFGGGFPGAPQ